MDKNNSNDYDKQLKNLKDKIISLEKRIESLEKSPERSIIQSNIKSSKQKKKSIIQNKSKINTKKTN